MGAIFTVFVFPAAFAIMDDLILGPKHFGPVSLELDYIPLFLPRMLFISSRMPFMAVL